ncbi:MAG: metallophosphoesterase [Saprospiraceae bacterium]
MLLLRFVLFTLLPLAPLLAHAGDPKVDVSKASSDGPHVFYRGGNIVVKTIERQDTANIVRVKYHTKREGLMLTCTVPETGDRFSFPLKNNLRVEKDRFEPTDRMLVLSDIEGNFEAFKIILKNAGVVNDQFRWTYGKNRLILVGDFFDRGLNVTEVLWLIYKLEDEAEAVGGKVHFLLGNHEALNLCGEYGYVRNKYIENAQLIGEDYGLWFDNNSELGRWLRTKNAVEKIGDLVFCHGGVSPELANSTLSLSNINEIARAFIGTPYNKMTDSLAQFVYNPNFGIMWFRGAAKNKISTQDMDNALKFVGAERIVVGHTLVQDITALYDGRLICIDLLHDENLRIGVMKSLLIEDGALYNLHSTGQKNSIMTAKFTGREKNGGG